MSKEFSNASMGIGKGKETKRVYEKQRRYIDRPEKKSKRWEGESEIRESGGRKGKSEE
jgi:hypothetical protein